MIRAILACEEQGGVGKNGQLPWPHIPRDFQWFMDQTFGHVIVMGRTTWDDPQLGHPMPDRISYVVTSRPESCPAAHGHLSADLLESIVALQDMHPEKTIWIIGGVHLITQTLSVIDQFVLSRIPGQYDCDRFLPMEELNQWKIVWQEAHPEVIFQILQNPNRLSE